MIVDEQAAVSLDIEPQTDRRTDDSELSAVRSKDRAATERFVRKHAGWMLSVARRIAGDTGHADDIIQSAFANIFKHLDAFDGRSSVTTWMYRIVVNEALMTLRKQRRAGADEVDGLMPVFDANGCRVEGDWTTFETPENLMQRSQTKAMVRDRIDLLPDKYRIVLVLRDIEELPTAQVAEMLELSEANVKVRLHRARAALKSLLEPLIRGQEL